MQVKVGIIGGTGLEDPQILENARFIENVDTPYGKISDRLVEGSSLLLSDRTPPSMALSALATLLRKPLDKISKVIVSILEEQREETCSKWCNVSLTGYSRAGRVGVRESEIGPLSIVRALSRSPVLEASDSYHHRWMFAVLFSGQKCSFQVKSVVSRV